MKKSIFFILLVFNISSYSQSNVLDNISDKFKEFRINNLVEKIYLHTDRPSYVTGEAIWFKIYVSESASNLPLHLSKIMYVELLDTDNKPVYQTKIKLNSASGNGNIPLAMSLKSGIYTLRAYTHWMKNYTPNYYFHQKIQVFNTFKNSGNENIIDTTSLKIELFPEGGNLIENAKNTIGFKISKKGNPFSTKGYILNEKNDTIVKFKSNQMGLGKFTINQSNGKLKGFVTDKKFVKSFQMVDFQKDGFAINIIPNAEKSLSISLKSNNIITGEIFLIAHSRGIISKKLKTNLVDGAANFEVSTNDLPIGVSQFEVFDEKLSTLGKRLYAKLPFYNANIEVKTNQKAFSKREKIELEIVNSNVKYSQLSMSVFAIDSLNIAKNQDIYSYYLLTSDLQNVVSQPQYYFENQSIKTIEDLDLLMLTSTYKYSILGNNFTSKNHYPEIKDLIIQAIVRNTETKQLAENVECFLSFPSLKPKLYTSRSGADGKVYFEVNAIENLTDAIFQTNALSGRTYSIEPQSPYSENYLESNNNIGMIKTINGAAMNSRSIEMQINNVFSKSNFEAIKLVENDSLMFFGKADEIYKLDDFVRFKTMAEVLKEYIFGVKAVKRNNKYALMVSDSKNKGFFSEPPLVLLDGVPIFNIDSLMNFSPLKIKTIRVVTHKYFWGKALYGGIASFQTYDGDMGGFPIDQNWLVTDFEGVQQNKKFISNEYDNDIKKQSRKPDFRNLLYWQPNISIEPKSTQKFNFYASDKIGKYKIIINGIDADGKPLSTSSEFEVK